MEITEKEYIQLLKLKLDEAEFHCKKTGDILTYILINYFKDKVLNIKLDDLASVPDGHVIIKTDIDEETISIRFATIEEFNNLKKLKLETHQENRDIH